MDFSYSNYIIIYGEINESKLLQYESILKICNDEHNFSLIFIKKNKKKHDDYINILCKNETILSSLVSGKIDIYYGNNVNEV